MSSTGEVLENLECGTEASDLLPAVFVLTTMPDFSCCRRSLALPHGVVQGGAHAETLACISVLRKLCDYRAAGTTGGSEFLTWQDTGFFKFVFGQPAMHRWWLPVGKFRYRVFSPLQKVLRTVLLWGSLSKTHAASGHTSEPADCVPSALP